MASYHVAPLERLIEQLEKMPGIGHKSAQRLAYYILNLKDGELKALTSVLEEAHEKIHYCSVCCNLTDQELCPVCQSDTRDRSVICVVEDPRDVFALERINEFNGLYHVLHGTISPLSGVGPDDLCISELLKRLSDPNLKEIIMATNPTIEGEATAMYLSRLIKPMGIRVTRLAYGIPVGGDLEYADEVTLSRAMEGRREL